MNAVHSEAIKDFQKSPAEKQTQDVVSSKKKGSPTLLSGSGKTISGNLPEHSAMGIILQPSVMKLSYQDDISPDKINIKGGVEFILEASNYGANSRVAAELMLLYGMAKTGTSIYLEKGSNMEKFALSIGHKLENGDTLKWDYGTYTRYLEYHFSQADAKKTIGAKQIGTSVSYTHNDTDRDAIVRELTGTVRLFRLDSVDTGSLGKISRELNSVFEQFAIQ